MRKRILIADDEIDSFRFIQDSLEEYGYNVVSVDNPESALKAAKQSFFDLVLLDINMPKMNGIEIFKEIKKFSPLSVVVMMTAGAPEALVEEAVKEGTFAVVRKPFKIDRMIDTVEKALNTTTILVVDDLFTDREVLKDLFEQRGFKCASAEDGYQAVELFKAGKPDVVLVDIKMPGMDGFEVLEKIKQMSPGSDVIMMSAYLNEGYLEKALKLGALTCMCKPLKIDNIIDVVDKLKKEALNKVEHYSVLLVEDDEDLRATFKDLLTLNGYVVTSFGTGAAAVLDSKKTYYDSVIMDLKLPDMSGIDVIHKIKEVNPDIAAILMTAHESLDAAIAAIKEKVYDFLVKPVSPDVLLKSLRKGIESSKKEFNK
jgi:DNA-binding NtrC family response regulator